MAEIKPETPSYTFEARTVPSLEALNAITPQEAELLRRSITLAGGDADSYGPKHLEHLEGPDASAVLLPEEKSMLPELWNHMHWPVRPAAEPAPEPEEFGYIDASQISGHEQSTVRTAIDQLPEELQTLARRIALGCGLEPDGGIALADVTESKDHPGLTPDEQELMVTLRVALLPFAEKQPTVMRPILNVPPPGRHEKPLEHDGSTPIRLVSNVSYTETAVAKQGTDFLDRQIAMNQAVHIEVEVAEGEHVALLPHNRNACKADEVLQPGLHNIRLLQKSYRVERWKDQVRLETSDVEIPHVKDFTHNLSPYAGYDFRTNGDPLPRVIQDVVDCTEIHNNGARSRTASFVYDFDAKSPDNLDDADFVPRDKPPVPPGRYQPMFGLTIDVFPSGAVRAKYRDHPAQPMAWLAAQRNQVPTLKQAVFGGRQGQLWLRMDQDGQLSSGNGEYTLKPLEKLRPELKIN